jgi:hypothetical protein
MQKSTVGFVAATDYPQTVRKKASEKAMMI